MTFSHIINVLNEIVDIYYHACFSGTQLGEIHVFNVPAKGTNVTLKESLIGNIFVYSNCYTFINIDLHKNILTNS